MPEIDQRMTQLRTDSKMTSPSACRVPSSGNRHEQIKKLEKRKADLQKLQDFEGESEKAQPAWFR